MSNVVIKNEPELPLKYVYYADYYGDFIGFSKEKGSQRYMCSCSKIALLNKIDLVKKYCPSSSIFGRSSQEIFSISEEDLYSSHSILDKIVFKNKICHQCNKKMPTKTYCHEMYGGKFKQTYGWYIKKMILELGIYQYRLFLDDSTIPIRLLKLVKIDKMISELKGDEHRTYEKQKRRIWNFAENEIRIAFDHKKIGDGWVSETILYHLVSEIYPDVSLKRHYRPQILEGLELDIFIPHLNVGIEYQGIQHYKPIKHWGGEEALKKTKERDNKKRLLCLENDIILIYFEYTETLTLKLVNDRINKEYLGLQIKENIND